MNPCIGKYVAFMSGMWLALQRFGSFHEIVDTAFAGLKISALVLLDAMGYPVYYHCPGPVAPKFAVDLISFGVNNIEPSGCRRLMCQHIDGGRCRLTSFRCG